MTIRTVIAASHEWGEGMADAWAQRLRDKPDLVHTVASGTTPKPLYALMHPFADLFHDATIFLLDEFGGLPVGHPARSQSMVRSDLLARIDLRADHFRVPLVDGDIVVIDQAAETYDNEVHAAGGLDLAILGVGTNGHLGMNEPGSAADSPTRRVQVAASTSAATSRYGAAGMLPTWGVTIGLRHLLHAREVWVLATGPTKTDAVNAARHGPVTTALPASLLQDHPNCTFWLDEAADGR